MRNPRVLAIACVLSISMAIFPAKAGIRVVSDLDDTAKITNVGDPFAMVVNGLFSKRSFAGIRELYLSFAIQRGYAIDYVTGAPQILKTITANYLRVGGFPKGDLYLKPSFGGESLRVYKFRVIHDLMRKYPQDRFILIGDDTQSDFDAYDDIFRYAPDRVLAIYIRKITNHNLPPSSYPFLTAFDVARTEYVMGRMDVEDISPIALAILGERRDKRIIPGYSYCPAMSLPAFDARVEKWNREIGNRVQKICQSRHLASEFQD